MSVPPSHEVFTKRQLIERHAHLLSASRVEWALRNRRRNGLDAIGAVLASPCGETLVHEPKFLQWFFGLAGRSKPRALRGSQKERS